ncbi:MAG TPA: hypothetical protein VI749_06345 [Candidatus Omnitrophota bacterium]|nr:hypothetical protein [Candidatus Omnitrophota bacterium]
MLKTLQRNENGIVFVAVLMIIVVMMAVTVGIIGLNVSQVTFAEQEIKRIKAELLAVGALAYTFANQTTTSAASSITLSETLDGISYQIDADITSPGTGPNGSSPLTIVVDY